MRFLSCVELESMTRTVSFVPFRAQIQHDLTLRSFNQRYPLTSVSLALSSSSPLRIYVKLLASKIATPTLKPVMKIIN
jgi:hypothetical protein